MEKTQLANVMNMDAKVSFDDLVNIFVSRHEEDLHQKRARIQFQIKELNASKVKLIQAVRDIAHDNVTDRFETMQNEAIKTKFTVMVAEDGDLAKDPFWNVDVKMRVDVIDEDVLAWRPKTSTYSDDVSQSCNLVMKVRICEEQITEWNGLIVELGVLKEALLLVNGDIQSIDRKTRQIKGLLATKKLEAEGLTNLLESKEVQDILKLTHSA